MKPIHKIFRLLALFIALSLIYSRQANCQPANPKSGKDITVQQWVNGNFARGKVPPFSFKYGGLDSKTFIANWKYTAEKQVSTDPAIQKSLHIYTDPKTNLIVKCFVTSYTDFPAVEWVIKFLNASGSNTPVIEMADAIDYSFKYNREGSFILHHSLGSDAKRSDFQSIDETMLPGKVITMMPSGGRSSDNAALPFFNIESPGSQGVIVAIGWTGKWHADIMQVDNKSVSLQAGLARMKLILYPGEEIRTPSVSLLFWKGDDRMEGHNHVQTVHPRTSFQEDRREIC